MKELGIVILKNGKVFKFGDYCCYIRRDNENPKHFHDSSFLEVLKENKEDFPFITDVDNFRLTGNLIFMAQNNCFIMLNATMGSFAPDTPTLLAVSPNELTPNQKESLIGVEKSFNYFDSGIIHIDIINHEGETVKNYNAIGNFYNDLAQYDYCTTEETSFHAFKRSM
jgi:hypothetical protein